MKNNYGVGFFRFIAIRSDEAIHNKQPMPVIKVDKRALKAMKREFSPHYRTLMPFVPHEPVLGCRIEVVA